MQKLSGLLFYCFGSVFFIAYFCYYNQLLGGWPLWIFEVFDLPFALVACLYGGTSLHVSLTKESEKGRISAVVISIILIALFAGLALLNYWELFGFPVTK